MQFRLYVGDMPFQRNFSHSVYRGAGRDSEKRTLGGRVIAARISRKRRQKSFITRVDRRPIDVRDKPGRFVGADADGSIAPISATRTRAATSAPATIMRHDNSTRAPLSRARCTMPFATRTRESISFRSCAIRVRYRRRGMRPRHRRRHRCRRRTKLNNSH